MGYALSKFLGIKFVSEASSRYREVLILGLIGCAELALLGFALVPPPWNAVFLFLNGLPLGMIWGLVFSYLEGRRLTEVMGLILCASFIFASAQVKECGQWMLGLGVTETSMPFWTGMLYAPFLLAFVWLLRQLPPPDAADELERTTRRPMNRAARWAFFRRFAGGLITLVVVYTLLTAFRDFRDNFQANIFHDLRGDQDVPFTHLEQYVMYGVLPVLMLLVLVHNNFVALWVNHLVIMAGAVLVGGATWMYQQGWIVDDNWWILTGIGSYMAYIPFNCILFERLIATFRHVANVGFLIYVADAFGYLGSIFVMIYKDFFEADLSWFEFFAQSCYLLAAIGGAGTMVSLGYFCWKYWYETVSQTAVAAEATT